LVDRGALQYKKIVEEAGLRSVKALAETDWDLLKAALSDKIQPLLLSSLYNGGTFTCHRTATPTNLTSLFIFSLQLRKKQVRNYTLSSFCHCSSVCAGSGVPGVTQSRCASGATFGVWLTRVVLEWVVGCLFVNQGGAQCGSYGALGCC